MAISFLVPAATLSHRIALHFSLLNAFARSRSQTVKLDLFFPHLAGSQAADEQGSELVVSDAGSDVVSDSDSDLGTVISSELDIAKRLLEDGDLSDSTLDDNESNASRHSGDLPTEQYGFDKQIARLRHYVRKDLRRQAFALGRLIPTFGVDEDDYNENSWIEQRIHARCNGVRDRIEAALPLFPVQIRVDISLDLVDLVEKTRERFRLELENIRQESQRPYQNEAEELIASPGAEAELYFPRSSRQAKHSRSGVKNIEIALNSPSSGPLQPTDGVLLERELEKKRSDRLWNHTTISRDQTAASDFRQELLLIFRTSRIVEKSLGFVLARRDTGPNPPHGPHPSDFYVNFPPSNGLSQLYVASTPEMSTQQRLPPIAGPSYTLPLSHSQATQRQSETLSQEPVGFVNIPENGSSTATLRTPESSETVDHGTLDLLGRISALEVENRNLKTLQQADIRYETVYLIQREPGRAPAAFLDEPTWAFGPRGEVLLKALFPIPDVEGWLGQRQDVTFSIGKYYIPKEQDSEVQKAVRDNKNPPPPKPSSETIRLESQQMKDAMEAFFADNPKLKQEHPNFNSSDPLPAPYIFWYHNRSPTAFDNMTDDHRKLLLKLTGWIDDNYGDMYARVDEQFKRGVVSYESMVFLVKPGDGVVLNSKPGQDDGLLHGKIAEDCPSSVTQKAVLPEFNDSPWKKKVKDDKKRYLWNWALPVWQYSYDGSFYRKRTFVNMEMEADDFKEETRIQNLNIYPLKYASAETRALLEQRGKTFWSCRERRLIAFDDKKGIYGVSAFLQL